MLQGGRGKRPSIVRVGAVNGQVVQPSVKGASRQVLRVPDAEDIVRIDFGSLVEGAGRDQRERGAGGANVKIDVVHSLRPVVRDREEDS